MRTAKVHIPQIDGIFYGDARCYELNPPLPDLEGGPDRQYVTVVVQPGRPGHQLSEVHVYAAEPKFGAVSGPMRKMPGSSTLHFHPEDPEHGWRYALMQIGVEQITD